MADASGTSELLSLAEVAEAGKARFSNTSHGPFPSGWRLGGNPSSTRFPWACVSFMIWDARGKLLIVAGCGIGCGPVSTTRVLPGSRHNPIRHPWIPIGEKMSNWLHNLPVVWMAIVVFGFTYVMAVVIYGVVMALAVGERARSFKIVSAGMISPLGIIFGLFVAFTAAQVWNDNAQANAAVDREASALRAIVILAGTFPGDPEARLRGLIRDYITEA